MYEKEIRAATKFYWNTRTSQASNQASRGVSDAGARSAVTGGKQMSKFEALAKKIAISSGVPEECIFTDTKLELPGYYRPEKKWDFLIVWDDELLCAIEFKSQVGPSFGNNFNNRTEEAIGTATDLWVAYREGAFGQKTRPFLAYFFLLEDCTKSTRPVSLREPHFDAFEMFKGSSYYNRYSIFLKKLKLERLYDSVGIALSKKGSDKYTYDSELNPVDIFIDLESYLKNYVRKKTTK